jgi:hypothetical protein
MTPRRRLPTLVPLLLALLGAPRAAPAVEVGPACKTEAEKYCKPELKLKKHARDAVLQCLAAYREVLWAKCRAHVDVLRACRDENRRFCEEFLGDEAHRCLDRNRARVSRACRDVLPVPPPVGATDDLGACGLDFDGVCGDVAPGEGREWRCLEERRDAVSAACRADLDRRAPKPRLRRPAPPGPPP